MNRYLLTFISSLLCALSLNLLAEHQPASLKSSRHQEVQHFNSKQIVEIFQKQLQVIKEGDISRAYRDYTSKEFRESTSEEGFQSFINNFEVLSKNKSLKIHALFFENNIGTLQGTLLSDSGECLSIDYDVIEENGQWKIMGIQLFRH